MGEHRLKSHGWAECALPPIPTEVALDLQQTATRFYSKGPCRVLVSQEPRPRNTGRSYWHLSISCEHRYPTWDEIFDARYSLLPLGLTFAQILPPLTEYTNIHRNCFHLWELENFE